MTVWALVEAATRQPTAARLRNAFDAALQAIHRTEGAAFCPACRIDLLTNPEVRVYYDLLLNVLQIHCDCQRGAYQITRERLDDLTI